MNFSAQQSNDRVLLNDGNGTEAEIFLRGALLNRFCSGGLNVVAGFSGPEAVATEMTTDFRSARLSPFVCRMRNGRYNWEGREYRINNGFFLGDHAIHGLVYGSEFSVKEKGQGEGFARVTLVYGYPGDDPGYPWPLQLSVDWELRQDCILSVTTRVVNVSGETIPLSDGWHPYFRMDIPIDECLLRIGPHEILEFDADLLPTGRLIQDERFREAGLLKGHRLDNCFKPEHNLVTLTGRDYELEVRAGEGYPFLQVYIPAERDRIALENLSSAPDAFNNGMGLVRLAPGRTFIAETSYRIRDLRRP